jgi:HSP20 family protein
MATKDLTTAESPIAKRTAPDFTDQLIQPFNKLKGEVDRLFDSFGFGLPALGLGTLASPAIEFSETDKAYKVTAELAGMDPEDVDVTFEDGILRIAGEKKEEREKSERGYRLSERSYGAFERLIELPSAADGDKIKADFKNGLLTVSVPKNRQSKSKKIPVSRQG